MNKLFRETAKVELNGRTCSRVLLKYGEQPEGFIRNLSWREIISGDFSSAFVVTNTLFRKIPCVRMRWDWESVTYSEKEFEAASVSFEYEEEFVDNYTFKELQNQLPATDFINWCKDQGVNVIITT